MGSTEHWVFLKDDGTIMLHTENDGWRFMRRGAEAIEEEITLEKLKSWDRDLYNVALRKLGKGNNSEGGNL